MQHGFFYSSYLFQKFANYFLLKNISRSVWILSLVSLFTDMASEMLYPIMPFYLKSIGYSVFFIGVIEGIAEATAGLSKGYFGKLSDATGKRVPFVRFGYSLSAISKPIMGLLIQPLWILFARTIDRLGKGVRTGARDAILSGEATLQTKGKVFGFHRSMDTLGAVLGPVLALLYLYFYPDNYKTLFLIAFIPGLLAIASTFFLKKENGIPQKNVKGVSFFSFVHYWKESPSNYRKLAGGLLVFALFNSSDVFLLLRLNDSGLSDKMVIGIYIFYNLVYAIFALPLGMLADKIGLKFVFVIGLLLFGFVYVGMGITVNLYIFILLFFVYGLYAAATEGISKAWISNICDRKDVATAIGTYSAFQSICAMLSSSIAGFIWYKAGNELVFYLAGSASFLIAVYFIKFVPYKRLIQP